ncbi:MAG: histidine decarboxylase, partial [Maribacter dokdonensis]
KIGINAWTNKGAITVVLPKVSETIKKKWQLATDDITHVICMPNVTKSQIDEFIKDIIEEKEHARFNTKNDELQLQD